MPRPFSSALAVVLLISALQPAVAEEELPSLDPAPPNLAPAGSEPAGPGAVAEYVLAHDLFALGLARKDTLAVIAAAKLAFGVDLKEGELKPEQAAGQPAGSGPASDSPVSDAPADGPADGAAMLAAAGGLAGGDDGLAGLIEEVAAASRHRRPAPVASALSHLAPGQADVWKIPLYGSERAELAVVGGGRASLDVRVADESGQTICQDTGWSDRFYCDFTPGWNGYFLVTVRNGGAEVSYRILSD